MSPTASEFSIGVPVPSAERQVGQVLFGAG